MLLSRDVLYRYTELLRDGDLPRREMASTFGTRIKELRTKQKLTLEQLAQATSSAKSYIWELENKIRLALPPINYL